MNDDNGLAALGAALVRADYLSPNGYPTTDSFAAAILRNGAVFLPEGLGPVMVGMAKEIAALRAAPLEEITKTRPASWNWADSDEMDRAIRIARSAALAAKETP